jgi:inner membrane protein
MPSPVGHALGGLAATWLFRSNPRVALAGAALAVIPDFDLLIPGWHRTYTHSVGAVAVVGVLSWLVLRRRYAPGDAVRFAAALMAAYASHLLLDWLGSDPSTPPGLAALWPFSSQFYISNLDVFVPISRRYWNLDEFVWGNLRALVRELVIMVPVAAAARYVGLVLPFKTRRTH